MDGIASLVVSHHKQSKKESKHHAGHEAETSQSWYVVLMYLALIGYVVELLLLTKPHDQRNEDKS